MINSQAPDGQAWRSGLFYGAPRSHLHVSAHVRARFWSDYTLYFFLLDS